MQTISFPHNVGLVVSMIPPRGSKSDDSYRDGDANPRDTFHNCKKIRGSKNDDSYRDGDADPHDPCDCSCFS